MQFKLGLLVVLKRVIFSLLPFLFSASLQAEERKKSKAEEMATAGAKAPIKELGALGKTTNAIEDVISSYIIKDEKYINYIREIREYHLMVREQLFDTNHPIKFKLFAIFDKVEAFCSSNTSTLYAYIYDQIIATGEIASTTIISEYLNKNGSKNKWLDARDIIRTDNHYTDARIDWAKTQKLAKENNSIKENELIITQGFIGATKERNTTTLGREGSDFSGAIFANVLEAEKLIIWKDVKGVYNTDPNVCDEAIFLEKISYKEATEMTYYGAKVIHPKTIRPLQNKDINLEVRSFLNPIEQGTLIFSSSEKISYPPIVVQKNKQVLLSFSSKDFSFTEAENLRMILKSFDEHRLKINIIQTGAITLSVVIDNKPEKINQVKKELSENFEIRFNNNLTLLTIRHYDYYTIEKYLRNKLVLLEQKTRETLQVLMRDE